MQRQLTPLPMWMTLVALIAAGALVILLAFTLRRESTFDHATERALQSSLLPDDWSTYGADVWSVGYPNTWTITRTVSDATAVLPAQDHIAFSPDAPDGTTYLRIEKDVRTLADIEAVFGNTPGVTRSAFRFAGYPAVKFSTYRTDEYYVAYEDAVYRIVTDYPKSDEIGIMLATFRFGD